jgi:hypothetical protein
MTTVCPVNVRRSGLAPGGCALIMPNAPHGAVTRTPVLGQGVVGSNGGELTFVALLSQLWPEAGRSLSLGRWEQPRHR